MNDELRITNKRLRNDIFKIFENYSKQLLTDFVTKHNHQSDDKLELKENLDKFNLNNQTLTEDEYYDSDLSEGEIILSSRSLKDNKHNQETQTDYQFMNEIDLGIKKENDDRNDDKNDDRNDELLTPLPDEQINQDNDLDSNVNQLNEQIDQSMNQLNNNDEKPNIIDDEQTEIEDLDKKTFVEQNTQTDLNLKDLKNIDYLKEIQNEYNFRDLNQLKKLLNNKSTNDPIETHFKKEFKDSINQTELLLNDQLKTTQTCTQCSIVQNLLIEFQNKIDRIDSSIVQREDLYNERINVLQEENNRLQNELHKIVQIKDDLLNQKDKMIIELNNEIVNQKEKIMNLEESILKTKEEYEKKLNKEEIYKNQSMDNEPKLDNQNIDNQLSIVNKNINYSNQKGLINILETIIKSLQARIDHKDEAIKDYQQLLVKTQEEHQQEIHKLMKNYKKVTENCTVLKSIQSSSNINQEQFETALTKYNDQLIEQKKNLEIQDNKLKKLKFENERLKLKSNSTEELNIKLRKDNEELNRLVEKNVKFIEKLKSAIKEERATKHNEIIKQNEHGKLMQLSKLKEETDKLIKLLTDKDKIIKELQLNKWNLEKKISELIRENKAELNSKQQELEKMMNNQLKLKNLLEKLENEKNALKKRQVNVIKHQSDFDRDYSTKEIQTNNLESNNLDNFIDSSLEETTITKSQLKNNEKNRELINILELKRLKAKNESINRTRKEQVIVHQSLKGKKSEIKKNSNSCDF